MPMPSTDREPIATATARGLYDARYLHQLSSEYSILGDLPLHAATPSTRNPPDAGPLTRFMTWNAGGEAGTMASTDKLRMLCLTMLCQGIHIACINEGHSTKEQLSERLRELRLQHQFCARGQGTQVVWLVQSSLASRIHAELPQDNDRVSSLILVGPCKQRTLVVGLYGFAGATTEARSGLRQQELWTEVAPLIRSYREAYHHVVVMGDLNVVPAPHLSSSSGLLFNTVRQFTEWSHDMDLHNALLVRCPRASLEEGFFSRSKLLAGTAQLALLDHILVSPGIVRGAAILTLPAGSDRGCPWGDHDPIIADMELGFNPAPSLPKRPPIRWAHFYPPGEWARHEADLDVNATLDSVLCRLGPAINCPDAVDLNAVFADLLSVAMPKAPTHTNDAAQSDDPISTAAGRMLGRMRRAGHYVRECMPRDSRTALLYNEPRLRELLFHPEDTWADPLEQATDLRASLAYRHCKTGAQWRDWLTTLSEVQKRLQRVVKHHRVNWRRLRATHEVEKATQEARAGKPQRAINLIFGRQAPSMVDNAFWRQVPHAEDDGTVTMDWSYITDEAEVEAEAIRHVSNMFPPPPTWHPHELHATFPDDYVFAGQRVVSDELAAILHRVDPVDFSDALNPMTLEDFDALLRQQSADSSPGCSGISYGHLRAMGVKARQVCVMLINRYIQFQEAPAAWLEVGIALIPKSDGLAGLGDGRPISLLEALLKLATAFVGKKLKRALLQHPSLHDPPPPARRHGRLHRQQLFDSGAKRGCHEAFIMLTTVMQGLHAQGRDFVLRLVSTDVKGAFNRTPTGYMDQRYRGLGMSNSALMDRLRNLLQSIDCNSTFRVRVRHGYTKPTTKDGGGLHQGETLSPSKYSWSVDPLLEYLEQLEGSSLGIDLGFLLVDGISIPFDGSYTIHTPTGDVTFFHQGGRLVAILFADDLVLLAETMKDAQVLLSATNEFYTAASATLCAPKSQYTTSYLAPPWSITLFGLEGSGAAATEHLCRTWQRDRRLLLQLPARPHTDVLVKGDTICLQGDPLFLEHLGDPVAWLDVSRPAFSCDHSTSLLCHLQDLLPVAPAWHVANRPLHVLNPRTGKREYLTYVPPHRPMRYLGIPVCANMDWNPALLSLKAKLAPKLSKVKLGKKLGLPNDVFILAASTHVMGIINYYAPPVPYSSTQLATINNLVSNAFRIGPANSVHQARMPQPIGYNVPDVELQTATIRIQLGLRMLHARDMEGQTLRWCLRAIQESRHLPDFPWSTLRTPPPGARSSFADAVTTSLQQVHLCIRTDSTLYPDRPSQECYWEQGLIHTTPAWVREALALLLRHVQCPTWEDLQHRRNWPKFRDLQRFFADAPPPDLPPITRIPLWRHFTTPFEGPPVPGYAAISDGTGDGVIGACHLSDASDLATIIRLDAGDTAGEAELVGLIVSHASLQARQAPPEAGRKFSDCQSAIALWEKARAHTFDPMLRPHGRAAILQLFIATQQPYAPLQDWPCSWIPGHSDNEDPDSIDEESKPYFDAHVTCDKLATESKRLPALSRVTGFEVDYLFFLGDASGCRCFTPLVTHVAALRISPDYHAQQTQRARVHNLGTSWRDIPMGDLDIPQHSTPWDSRKACDPYKRDRHDSNTHPAQLLDLPQLKPAAVRGHGRAAIPCRMNILGGLFTLTESDINPINGRPTLGTCIFCCRGEPDTLFHALHECPMDRWTDLPTNWPKQAAQLIHTRFEVNTLTAVLHLGCPLDLSAPSRPPATDRTTKRKRPQRTMQIVPYAEVRRAQLERSTAPLNETGAHRWFAAMNCSIREKEHALRQAARTSDADMPAAQLLRAALAKQQTRLAEERELWHHSNRLLAPEDDANDIDRTLGLESRAAPDSGGATTPISPLMQLQQCLKHWMPPWEARRNRMNSTFPTAWSGVPTVLLSEQQESAAWPSPPTDSWLFAGLVTNAGHLQALTSYGVAHQVPIMVILGHGLDSLNAPADDRLEWPLPHEFTIPAANYSALFLDSLGTPGHATASLCLLSRGQPNPTLPAWLRLWPLLYSGHSNNAAYVRHATDSTSLRVQLVLELLSRPDIPWWRDCPAGATGQAQAAGIWTKELGDKLRGSMTPRAAAQLYACHFWNVGANAASISDCRAATASAICTLRPPSLSTTDLTQLQRFARPLHVNRPQPPRHHGWRGPLLIRVNLATVIDPATGLPVVYTPPRKHHQLGSVTTMYHTLLKAAAAWVSTNTQMSTHPNEAWGAWIQRGACSVPTCASTPDMAQLHGFVLPTGHLLCQTCFGNWESAIKERLQITAAQPCAKDVNGNCASCTLTSSHSRLGLRRQFIRSHLRDLCHCLLRHLPPNTANRVVIILHRELRDLHLTLDAQHLLGIPASIYGSLLGWFSWHYSRTITVPITSTPAKDPAPSEHWATACYNALCVVDLRQPAPKSRTSEESSLELTLSQFPALRTIHATLADHCGASTVALQSQLNRQNFRRDYGLDDTPLPAPADNSIGRHQDACCSICSQTTEDAWGEADGRDDALLQLWNCTPCAQWFHEDCLTEETRATLPDHAMTEEELEASPGWRCPECVNGQRFAINRILEIVRTEAGRYRLVLDYIRRVPALRMRTPKDSYGQNDGSWNGGTNRGLPAPRAPTDPP